MIKDKDNEFENERYLGMSHYYLGNWDSCNVYLKRSDEYFSASLPKRMAILPYLIVSYKKAGNTERSNLILKEFQDIAQDNECERKDLIIGNWAAYEAFDFLGKASESQQFLEDAYFEMKSRSKDIKNKADRGQFLDTDLHNKITMAWSKK